MLIDCCGFVLIFLFTLLLAFPLAKYIKRVYNGEKSWLDILSPFESKIMKMAGIASGTSMNWQQYLVCMVII